MPPSGSRPTSLILSGGVGLGAFQAGAFEVLSQSSAIEIRSVSGASIGALNGAIIAGNAPQDRVAKLRDFWTAVAVEALPARWLDPWGISEQGPLRRARNWGNVVTAHLLGSPPLFRPRLYFGGDGEARSLFDNRLCRETLPKFVDFDHLNAGNVRFCLATTDIEAGEPVFFDTAKGDCITVDHLIASSSLIPAFEPVRVGERLLADGGLSCNLPLEAEIGPERPGAPEPLCVAIDLFSPGGGRPYHLNRSIERSADILLGMQTRMRLAAFRREWALRARLQEQQAEAGERELDSTEGIDLLYLHYGGSPDDASFGKPFDLSPATLADRWRRGKEAASRLVATCDQDLRPFGTGLRVHELQA